MHTDHLPRSQSVRSRLPFAATCLLTSILAQSQPQPAAAPDLDLAARIFDKLSAREQDRVLEAVIRAVETIDTTHRRSLRQFADAASLPTKPRIQLGKPRGRSPETATAQPAGTGAGLPFPVVIRYEFGTGCIIGPGTDKATAKAAATKTLRSLLQGHPARADLTFAGLLQRLDTDRQIDSFAGLLTTWRNGAETFYEALERTAGSAQGVFHYDDMFTDWQRLCVPRSHADRQRLIASPESAQRGFQASFQSYWRYRSTREVLAATLLLDPATPLPGNLQRFEDRHGQDHSLRDCMALLLAVHRGDVAAAVAECSQALPALPVPLWQGEHDPYAALQQCFQAATPRMLALAPSTLALQLQWRAECAAATRQSAGVAWATFQKALPAKFRSMLTPARR